MLSSEAETFPPPRRQFQPLPDLVEQNTREKIITHDRLRILQFNVLADGLSGLRPDLGAFSRVQKEFMLWEMRRDRLLEEILQYDPDVVTLQECDHYHDFFLPELLMRGYSGYFAPKPASACLEVADRSDGCAIFYKRDVLRVISSQVSRCLRLLIVFSMSYCLCVILLQTLTYSLSKADVLSDEQQQHGHVMQIEDKQPRPQNQVALILLCEFLKNRLQTDPKSNKRVKPPVILATTHLKVTHKHFPVTQKKNIVNICDL